MAEMTFRFDWFDITSKQNFSNFLIPRYKGKDNLSFLEIGCFEGMGSCFLLENVLNGKECVLTVIDTFKGSTEHKELGVDCTNLESIFSANIEKWKNKVEIYKGRSQDILDKLGVLGLFGKEKYDFIFIDGAHDAHSVFVDAINGFKLLKIGGIIAFDDYLWIAPSGKGEDSPKQGIDVFLDVYKDRINVLLKDYQVWIEKL